MRHGNEIELPNGSRIIGHSDPTYEAWKLKRSAEFDKYKEDSDPTYEAWKLASLTGRA